VPVILTRISGMKSKCTSTLQGKKLYTADLRPSSISLLCSDLIYIIYFYNQSRKAMAIYKAMALYYA
jgi:hypothetical protein